MLLSRRPVICKYVGSVDTFRVTYQVVELDCGDTLVHARDDLHCNGSRVDMVRIEPVTQPRHAGCDLVELHAFFASICSTFVSHGSVVQRRAGISKTTRDGSNCLHIPRLKTNMVKTREVMGYMGIGGEGVV